MFSKLLKSARFLNRRLNYGKDTRAVSSAASESGGAQKGLVICCYEHNKQLELSPAGAELDQKCGGLISQQLNSFARELHIGKAFAITSILEYSVVAIASIGPKDACYNVLESLDEARENIRWGVGAGVKLLKERGCVSIEVDPCTAPDAAAEAAELAAWKFEVFKSVEVSRPPCNVSMYGGEASQLWLEGGVRGRAQNWARCLSDMPANKMTPVDLAQAALDVLCPLGVKVEAHDREWIVAQGMQAFLAVARGSCETPMFLECVYSGAGPNAPPVLLAAKGVTFDSGGLCLKECHSMTENRGSMAGAAVVLAAFQIIAQLRLPINVTGVIPICENMVSGQCMKVGDVVHALNGMSIQIENTDMEGRLMMADALVYGQSIYKPSLVIDVATFTHGVLMATGGGAFGCFSNCEAAWRALTCAGAHSGDRPWRFPLWHYFHKLITNDAAFDLRNKGCGYATPCLGAAFLKNFVCGDWLHMDITGVGKVAHSGAPPYLDTCRMTGRPTRTLAVLIQHIARASQTQGAQPCPPQDSQPCQPQPCPPCPPSPPRPIQPCPPNLHPPCPPSPPHPIQPCQPHPPCPPSPPRPIQPCPPQPHPPCPPQPHPPCPPTAPHPPCPPPPPRPIQPCPPQPHPPCPPPPPRPIQPCPPQPHPPCPPSPPRPIQPCPPQPPCPPSPHPIQPCPPQPHPPCPPTAPHPPRPIQPCPPQPHPPCPPSPPRPIQPCPPQPPCPPSPHPIQPCPPQPHPPCPPTAPHPIQPCPPQPHPPCPPQPHPPCPPSPPRPIQPCPPQPHPPCPPSPHPIQPCPPQPHPPRPIQPCPPQPHPPCPPSPPRPIQPCPPQPHPPCPPSPPHPIQPCPPQPHPPCPPSPPHPSQPCTPCPPCRPRPQTCPPSTQSHAPKPQCSVPPMKHKCR